MSGWAPAIPPEVLAAALARRGSVPPAPAPVPPPPTTGPVPLATRTPVTMPQAQAPGPLPMTRPGPTAPPIRMGAGGVNLAEPGPPGVPANGIPSVPAGYTPPTGQPPSPSDDPAISPEMRKAMQPVQDAQAALDVEGKKYQDLSGQMSALKPPSREDYKPALWKRIAAPFLGAGIGRNAGPELDEMLNAPYNRAVQGYEQQKSALQQQLEAERGIGIPLAESRARVAQEGFRNQLDTRKEAREESTAQSNAQYKSDLNEIRTNIAGDKLDEAQKKLDETAERNKNNAQIQNELLQVRQQLADAATERANKAKNGSDEQNGMTASEQRDFNNKAGRYKTEADHLVQQRVQMVGIPGDFAAKRIAAIDARLDEISGIVNKAQQDILDRRPQKSGTGAASGTTSAKGFQVPAGAPAPTKAGQALKSNGKIVAYSQDGKSWGPPQ
jgi:hypothetical protein